MATGDLAASKGLKTYTSAQDRRLGYDNDNQRGDDVAAVMVRVDSLEKTGGNRPTVILRKGNAQNAPATANEWGAVLWDVEEYDLNNLHNTTNTERVTLPNAGTVTVNALVKIGTTDPGTVARLRLTKNGVAVPGTTIDDKVGNPVPAEPLVALNTVLAVAAGDILRLEVSTNYGQLPIRSDQCRWSVAYNTLL